MGSDGLPLFTDGQQVLDSISIWIHKKNFYSRKESPCLPQLPWGDPEWKRLVSICILPLLFQGDVNLDSL